MSAIDSETAASARSGLLPREQNSGSASEKYGSTAPASSKKAASSSHSPRRRQPASLVPAVAHKTTGHVRQRQYIQSNQLKPLSKANEDQLHLLGRRLYGTENSHWFRGMRAASEEHLRLTIRDWLRVRFASRPAFLKTALD